MHEDHVLPVELAIDFTSALEEACWWEEEELDMDPAMDSVPPVRSCMWHLSLHAPLPTPMPMPASIEPPRSLKKVPINGLQQQLPLFLSASSQ